MRRNWVLIDPCNVAAAQCRPPRQRPGQRRGLPRGPISSQVSPAGRRRVTLWGPGAHNVTRLGHGEEGCDVKGTRGRAPTLPYASRPPADPHQGDSRWQTPRVSGAPHIVTSLASRAEARDAVGPLAPITSLDSATGRKVVTVRGPPGARARTTAVGPSGSATPRDGIGPPGPRPRPTALATPDERPTRPVGPPKRRPRLHRRQALAELLQLGLVDRVGVLRCGELVGSHLGGVLRDGRDHLASEVLVALGEPRGVTVVDPE